VAATPAIPVEADSMIDFNYEEIIALVLSLFALAFLFLQSDMLRALPGRRWLIASLTVLCAAYACTILEGTVLNGMPDVVEHACYTLNVALIAWWTWRHLAPARPRP
jgi:hypothetical protein